MHGRDRTLAFAIGGAILCCLLPLPFLGDLRQAVIPYIVLGLFATLLLYFGFSFLYKQRSAPKDRDILLIALLLRLVVLPIQPSLSDDAWRYVWDGRLVAEGISPYHHIPADPALAQFHDELLELQGYPETNTIYPPAAQLIFATAVSLSSPFSSSPLVPYYLYKLLLIAAELFAVWLLLQLLRCYRRSSLGAILYAWHPLAVVELAGQGHTDGLWVLSLGLALYGFATARAGKGLPGLSFGVATRLFPLLLLPLWSRFLSKRSLVVGGLLSIPFLLLLYVFIDPEAFSRYTTVAQRFTNFYEFNGGFYMAVKGLLDELHIKPSNRIAGGITTGLMLLGVAAITLWPLQKKTLSRLLAGVMGIVTLQIALSAKVHIWYFVLPLYLLAFVPDKRFGLAWLWVALIAPLTYLHYSTEPFQERVWVVALEWGGFAVLAAGSTVWNVLHKKRPTPEEPGEIQSDSIVKAA